MKFELKDICFFDCETTGVPAKGLKWDADFEQFPHVVQLAWSLGDKEKSYIIKPDNYEIPPETTAIHGIRRQRICWTKQIFRIWQSERKTNLHGIG